MSKDFTLQESAKNTPEDQRRPRDASLRSDVPAFQGLQRTIGNQAVLRLMESGGLQTKLRVSQPGDADEQEADRAAAQVVSQRSGPVLQRKCACGGTCSSCQEEKEDVIHRSALGGMPALRPFPFSIQRAAEDASHKPAAAEESAQQEQAKHPGERPHTVIVADDAPSLAPGQMRKTQFVALLQTTTCATADAVLASVNHTTKGCPYIKKWLGHYKDQDAAHLTRAMHKYAPETRQARSAHEAISLVNHRVHQATLSWAKTGKVSGLPAGLQDEIMGGGGGFLGAVAGFASSGFGSALLGFLGGGKKEDGSGAGGVQRKSRDGAEAGAHDAATVRSQLGSGHALDSRVQGQMSSAFGYDFSGVRVHTDGRSAGLSADLNARAFTVGSDVAFAAGEYQPGTLIGDALIAHELAHVVQQGGHRQEGGPLTKDAGLGDDSQLEQEADRSAVGAVVSAWTGAKQGAAMIGANALPRLKSGLKLQRCGSCAKAQVKSPQDVVEEAKHCKLDDAAQKLKNDLITTFAFADVTQEEGSCWTAAELAKMKNALAKTPADQRSGLKGVTLLRVQTSKCKVSDPQGCFREDIDKQTGVRKDVIDMADSAFALDVEFEKEGSKDYRTDMSGKKIESLPSQDVLLHEAGHAIESGPQREAKASRFRADLEASKKQDVLNAAVDKINKAAVPSFNVTFSSNPKASAYQHALIAAGNSMNAMVAAIGDPSNASAAKIKSLAAGFKAALKTARAKMADLKKKEAALPPGSSVIMNEVEGPLDARLALGAEIETAFDARLAAQQTLEPAEKLEKAESASIAFGPKGSVTELDISRRLAELIALVELKRMNIKSSNLRDYIKDNWPKHPEELFADLYQMSVTEPDGLKVFDADMAAFFKSPIGPKGHWKKDVDTWIANHTQAKKN
jgi:Domain of unknown function (DUF4157)